MAKASRASVRLRRDTESFQSLWRRFEKAVDAADVVRDYRKHESYEKQSEIKKRARQAAISREKKRMQETTE